LAALTSILSKEREAEKKKEQESERKRKEEEQVIENIALCLFFYFIHVCFLCIHVCFFPNKT